MNPLDIQFQLGILAESYKMSFILLKEDLFFIPGIASSGLSHLDLMLGVSHRLT